MTFPNLVVACCVIAITIVLCRCLIIGSIEDRQHRAAHRHITMMNAEIARRWHESQLNKESAD